MLNCFLLVFPYTVPNTEHAFAHYDNLHQGCIKRTGAEETITAMTCFVSNQMALDAVTTPLLFVAVQVQAALRTGPDGEPGHSGITRDQRRVRTTMTSIIRKRHNKARRAPHHRMGNEDFGLVAITVLLHFLSRHGLEADLHHGSECLPVCRSLHSSSALTVAAHLSETNPLTASTGRPLLTAGLLRCLFLSCSTGSVLFFLVFFFFKSSLKGAVRRAVAL